MTGPDCWLSAAKWTNHLKLGMKRFAIVCLYLLGFVLLYVPSRVCAQPILTNTPSVWTNLLHGTTNRGNGGGHHTGSTNHTTVPTKPPPGRGHGNSHGIIPPGQTPSPSLPTDVQTLLKQFQQQRAQIQSSLQNTTDAQRQQILQNLEALRDQMQAQLQAITAEAREQALDMRSQFGPGFKPGNSSGGGVNPTGHGGKPRP